MLAPFLPSHLIYVRMYDVTLGALVGLSFSLFVFPEHADAEFRKDVVPVLKSFSEYFTAIVDFLYKKKNAEIDVKSIRRVVEQELRTFPAWVYQTGFDIALREGHRHFLVRLEQSHPCHIPHK